jgi:hypothetical protein
MSALDPKKDLGNIVHTEEKLPIHPLPDVPSLKRKRLSEQGDLRRKTVAVQAGEAGDAFDTIGGLREGLSKEIHLPTQALDGRLEVPVRIKLLRRGRS